MFSTAPAPVVGELSHELTQRIAGPRDLKVVYSPMHGVGASAVMPVLAGAVDSPHCNCLSGGQEMDSEVSTAQGAAVVALLRGLGAPVVKSEELLSVSVQPLFLRKMAVVPLGAAAFADSLQVCEVLP